RRSKLPALSSQPWRASSDGLPASCQVLQAIRLPRTSTTCSPIAVWPSTLPEHSAAAPGGRNQGEGKEARGGNAVAIMLLVCKPGQQLSEHRLVPHKQYRPQGVTVQEGGNGLGCGLGAQFLADEGLTGVQRQQFQCDIGGLPGPDQ